MKDLNFTFKTTDNQEVKVYVLNYDYTAHVTCWGSPNDTFTINGRDAYEVLKSEGRFMTWAEIMQAFK